MSALLGHRSITVNLVEKLNSEILDRKLGVKCKDVYGLATLESSKGQELDLGGKLVLF